jgi:hypothetical protein
MAASDSLPAPVPPSRLEAGYRTGRSDSNISQTVGPGRASPVPAATFSTFRAPYAGRFLRTRSRIKRPFHGLRRDTLRLGTSSFHPKGRAYNDAAGFASRYGPPSCSPQRGL